MTDIQPTPPVEPKEPKQETPKLSPELQEIRGKSFKQIIAEDRKIVAPGTPEDEEKKKADEAAKADEEKKAQEVKQQEETKRQEDEKRQQEERIKHDEQIASKAAEDALAKREEEEKKRKEQETASRQENDDLKPVWLRDPNWPYKDKDGNPVTKDYAQQNDELTRIAELKANRAFEAREKARDDETTRKNEEKRQQEERVKTQQEAADKQLDTELQSDLTDLYTTDKLPKVIDEKNPNDPGIVARKALFETGIKVNQERVAKGLAPIRSIKIIFYEHYKSPTKQPAGANAPIMGGGQPPAPGKSEDEFNFARDHNKSMRQVLAEAKKRLAGSK